MTSDSTQPSIEQSGTVSRGVLKLIVLQAITCMPGESYPAFAEIVLAALGMAMNGSRASVPAGQSPDAPACAHDTEMDESEQGASASRAS